MIERYGVRSKLNAGAGEGGGGGEPTCVCNNHIHDATSVALGGFTKYIFVDTPSDVHWSVLAYHSEYTELIHNCRHYRSANITAWFACLSCIVFL